MRYLIEQAKDRRDRAWDAKSAGLVCECGKHDMIDYHAEPKRRVIVCRKCSRIITWLDNEGDAQDGEG